MIVATTAVGLPPGTGVVPSPLGGGALIVLAVCEPYSGLLSERACARRWIAANGGPVPDGLPVGIRRSRCRGCPAGEERSEKVFPSK